MAKTIIGTASDDTIDVGASSEEHRLEGLTGNDRLTGSSAGDVIIGGAGYDTLRGGGGDDVFLVEGTGQGEDTIFGDGGFDTIRGGAGDDTIRLVALTATHAIEQIDGGTGLNVVMGTGADNALNFSAVTLVNIARIDAGSGNDQVTGTSGDDTIIGGAGYDTLRGGGGDDVFVVEGTGQGEDQIFGDAGFDTIRGGAGDDTIRLTALGLGHSLEQIDGGAGLNIVAGTAAGNILDFSATALVNIARIDAGGGNDQITGAAGDDVIVGGAGNDTLRGGGGIDTALYAGNAASYQISGIGTSQVTVRHLASGDVDTLFNFAFAQFDNGTVSLAGGAQPVAGADAAQTAEDNAVTINVLANDSNGGSGTLSVTGVTQGAHGTVTLNANGTLTYTPQANYFGPDSFGYTLSNGTGTAGGTVNVTVTGVNDAPVAVNDSGFITALDTARTFAPSALLGNDSDVDGNPLMIASVGAASGGTVALVDGNVVFTPNAGYSGPASFDYTASDGSGGQDSATVSLTVLAANTAPVAADDTASASGSTVIAVLGNDSDADGGTLSISGFTQPLHGTVTLNPNNTFTYVPVAGYTGPDSFTYTLADGQGGHDDATVNIAVSAPSLITLIGTAGDDVIDVNSSSTPHRIEGLSGNDRLTGSSAGDVIIGGAGYDTLRGGGGDDVFLVEGTGQGEDTIFGDGGFDTIRGGAGDDTIRLVALTATHAIEQIDGGTGLNVVMGTGADNALNFSAVTLVNIARIDAGSGNDQVTGTSGDDTIIGGAGYDTLRGGGGDDVFVVEGTGQGEDQIFGDAGFDTIRGGAGDDTIRLTALGLGHSLEQIDGGAGLNIVAGTAAGNILDFSATALVNIARIDAGGGNDQITGAAGDDVIVGGAGNDTLRGGGGIDTALYAGNAASYQISGIGTSQVTVRHLASGDVDTLFNFAFAQFDNGTVSLAGGAQPVAGADAAQTAEDNAVTINVLANDSNGGSGTLSVTGVTQGAHGTVTLNANGTLTYTPQANYFGPDSFGYTLSNGTGTAGGTVNVTVTGVNDAPVAVNDSGFITALDTARTFAPSALLGNDSDVDGNPLMIASVGAASGGTVALVDGNVVFTPNAGYSGPASFDYTASDGSGGQDSATVSLTVLAANTAPVAADDTASASGSTVIAVLGNDSDADGGTLSISGFTQPLHGTLTLNPNNTFTYLPTAGYTGPDNFTYTLADGQGGHDDATVNIAVSAPLVNSNFRQILTSAPEQGWTSLNINVFSDVWTPKALRPAGDGPISIIGAWSSMAWDSNRGDLIFWGGGHAHYGGNEVYRWRSSTLTWERASLPSQVVTVGTHQQAIDGTLNAPIAAHTYDNSEFLPIADRWMTWGGAAYNTGGRFVNEAGAQTGPYFWDPSKADANKVGGTDGSGVDPSTLGGQMWQNREAGLPTGDRPGSNDSHFLGGTTAYTQENGKDVIYVSDGHLWKYTVNDVNNPAADTYEKVGIYWNAYGTAHGAGAIDPSLEIFVRTTGSANFTYWDLSSDRTTNRNQLFVPTDASGLFQFNRLGGYGMDFDPVRGNFVLWNGDPEVWILTPPETLSTSGWTLTRNPVPTLTEAPHLADAGHTTGVFGKWKYIAEQDIFLGVMDQTRGTVWAYKPDDWQPHNTLPTLTVEDLSDTTLAPGATMSANEFVDWTDANGDHVRFRFIDQTLGASSGHFRLGGVDQAEGAAVNVTDQQLLAGALVWVAGAAGSQAQIGVVASDPFGDGASQSFTAPDVGGGLAAMIASLGVDPDPDSGTQDQVTLAMADTLSQGIPPLATCTLMCAPNGSNSPLLSSNPDETYLGLGTTNQLGV